MDSPLSVAISVHDLTVKYGARAVLTGISTEIKTGEIRVILGTSGCGKTTLLKAMIGLLKPFSGQVKLFNEPVREQDDPQTAALLKKIGVLFQNGALLGSLTVEENIALPLDMHTTLNAAVKREIVAYKLSQVDLKESGPLYPSELSGGMRKRVALARALALDPPILFCDEPSAGLDPVTSAGLDQLLLRLRKNLGITIVVVTHELQSIDTIADNISFLYKGSLLFDGSYQKARALESGPVADFFSRQDVESNHAPVTVSDYFVEMSV